MKLYGKSTNVDASLLPYMTNQHLFHRTCNINDAIMVSNLAVKALANS
jgi:hypothetical protein